MPTTKYSLKQKLSDRIAQTARLWQQRSAEAHRGSGHAGAPMTLLYVLADARRGLTLTEIAERLKITGASVTRLVDWLEDAGLVSRRRLIGDGRSRLVVMEDKGSTALAAFDVWAGDMRDRAFADVSEDDLRTTLRVLDMVAARLMDASPRDPSGIRPKSDGGKSLRP